MLEIDDIAVRFVDLIDELLPGEVVSSYILGSYARGDWVFGLSDLDFYLIVRDHVSEDENHRLKFKKNLQAVIEEVRRLIPTVDVSCEYDTELRVRGSRVESFITSQDSRFIHGRNILKEIPKPSLKELKEYGITMVGELCDHWMRTEEKRKTRNLEYAVYVAQHTILKLAQNGLLSKGILKFKKKDIVKTFLSECQEFQKRNLVEEAYRIRKNWTNVRDDEFLLRRFIEKTMTFPQDFKNYISS